MDNEVFLCASVLGPVYFYVLKIFYFNVLKMFFFKIIIFIENVSSTT